MDTADGALIHFLSGQHNQFDWLAFVVTQIPPILACKDPQQVAGVRSL